MAKIKINCGYCNKSKGCNIKKDFRKLANEYRNFDEIEGDFRMYKQYYEFKLDRPFKERKYKTGDIVYFTFGTGRYLKKTEWECEWDCDYCCRKDCKDGIITFENIRHKKYITLKGKIINSYKHDSYIICLDEGHFRKVKHYFNEKDIELINKITDSIEHDGFDMIVISKEKYIKNII